MKCNKCGTECRDDYSFCTNCGRPLTADAEMASMTDEPQSRPMAEPKPSKPRRKLKDTAFAKRTIEIWKKATTPEVLKKVGKIAAIVVVATGICIGGFFWFKHWAHYGVETESVVSVNGVEYTIYSVREYDKFPYKFGNNPGSYSPISVMWPEKGPKPFVDAARKWILNDLEAGVDSVKDSKEFKKLILKLFKDKKKSYYGKDIRIISEWEEELNATEAIPYLVSITEESSETEVPGLKPRRFAPIRLADGKMLQKEDLPPIEEFRSLIATYMRSPEYNPISVTEYEKAIKYPYPADASNIHFNDEGMLIEYGITKLSDSFWLDARSYSWIPYADLAPYLNDNLKAFIPQRGLTEIADAAAAEPAIRALYEYYYNAEMVNNPQPYSCFAPEMLEKFREYHISLELAGSRYTAEWDSIQNVVAQKEEEIGGIIGYDWDIWYCSQDNVADCNLEVMSTDVQSPDYVAIYAKYSHNGESQYRWYYMKRENGQFKVDEINNLKAQLINTLNKL